MNESPREAGSTTARPMLEVTSLGSGSSGNALLLRTSVTTMLVDCGVGVRRLSRALASDGLALADVEAIVISHEHIDHIREVPRFAAHETRLLSTRGTASAGGFATGRWSELGFAAPVQIGDVEVHAFRVSHDASDPCAFLLRTPAGAVTVMTDLGCPAPAAAEAIAESDLVVIEANHDEAMLRRGPYPAHLQRRILSDTGHLSNHACAELLAIAIRPSPRVPTVWLAHLSETNNRPDVATRTVARHLTSHGLHLDLRALPRRERGPTWRASAARSGHAQLTLDLF